MKPPRPSPLYLLAETRRVIAADDRELALQLLLKIVAGGERIASQLPDSSICLVPGLAVG